MFGLFGGDKKEEIKKPFEAFLGGAHFAAFSIPDDYKVGAAVNLKGALFLKGDKEFVVSQNASVVGSNCELQVDRNTGLILDKVQGTPG
jgi:hypothetical protein